MEKKILGLKRKVIKRTLIWSFLFSIFYFFIMGFTIPEIYTCRKMYEEPIYNQETERYEIEFYEDECFVHRFVGYWTFYPHNLWYFIFMIPLVWTFVEILDARKDPNHFLWDPIGVRTEKESDQN